MELSRGVIAILDVFGGRFIKIRGKSKRKERKKMKMMLYEPN